MSTEVVYLGHDNTIDLRLDADGTAQDLSSVTKITATFGDTLVESENASSGSIMWSGDGFVTGEIRLDVGAESIDAGNYHVPIIVYDPTNTTGVVWGTKSIRVVAEVEAT